MPELTSKKVMPTINTFDFDFFADNKGKRNAAQKVAIITTNSYIKLSLAAYRKLNGPEYFKVGIDIDNKAICSTSVIYRDLYI